MLTDNMNFEMSEGFVVPLLLLHTSKENNFILMLHKLDYLTVGFDRFEKLDVEFKNLIRVLCT